jgi:hypothetical protein
MSENIFRGKYESARSRFRISVTCLVDKPYSSSLVRACTCCRHRGLIIVIDNKSFENVAEVKCWGQQ